MKTKRNVVHTVIALLLAVCFVGGVSAPSFAAMPEDTVQPCIVGASGVDAGLSISSSGQATCVGRVSLRSGYKASLTLYLQKSSDGKTWKTQKTWTGSGSAISKTQYVSSGYKYRTRLTAKIYNSSGTLVDTATATSPVK